MAENERLLIRADPEQENLLQQVISSAEVDLAGICSSTATGATKLAEALQTERIDDLRQTLQKQEIDLIWLASAEPLSDAEYQFIGESGCCAISSEPWPSDLSIASLESSGGQSIRFAPLMRRSPGYLAAQQVLEEFGSVQAMNMQFRSGPGTGSLFARLFDAMDVLDVLGTDVKSMDAALTSPFWGSAGSVPETLNGLHGHITINIRFADKRCGCVAASDRGSTWHRSITLLGDGGCMTIDDMGFAWHAPDGKLLDEHREAQSATPGLLIGQQINRLLQQREAPDLPPDHAQLIALCEAARLSCRTGEGETPTKVLEMMQRP